jgi:hypothetical protein
LDFLKLSIVFLLKFRVQLDITDTSHQPWGW